ncbi:MAG: hypothetical protein ACLFPF_06095 [Halanaerobiales bacterium]
MSITVKSLFVKGFGIILCLDINYSRDSFDYNSLCSGCGGRDG